MPLIDARQHVTNPAGFGVISKPIGLALHHSVSGGSFFMAGETTPTDEINHIRLIDQYHVSVGFGGFAYHSCAFASGRSYQTGNFDSQRAHVKGRNHELGSMVAIGDYSEKLGPANLIRALGECAEAQELFWNDTFVVKGHGQWALPGWGTTCPGRLKEQVEDIEDRISTGIEMEEDDMKLVKAGTAWFVVDAMGKRWIPNRKELADYRKVLGNEFIEVRPSDVDHIPNISRYIIASLRVALDDPKVKRKLSGLLPSGDGGATPDELVDKLAERLQD